MKARRGEITNSTWTELVAIVNSLSLKTPAKVGQVWVEGDHHGFGHLGRLNSGKALCPLLTMAGDVDART